MLRNTANAVTGWNHFFDFYQQWQHDHMTLFPIKEILDSQRVMLEKVLEVQIVVRGIHITTWWDPRFSLSLEVSQCAEILPSDCVTKCWKQLSLHLRLFLAKNKTNLSRLFASFVEYYHT